MIKPQTEQLQSAGYLQELKVLQRYFKEQPREEVRLIFEFCEYDIRVAYKVLSSMTLPSEKEGTELVKQLIARPDRSEEILAAAIAKFEHSQLAGQQMPATIVAVLKPKKIEPKQLIMPFFEKLPKWLLFEVLQFLRPVEIATFVRMQPSLEAAFLSATTKKQDYYRSICQVLFPSAVPTLPNPSMFLPLKQQILANPIEFGPNLRHAAQTDLQNLVWHCQPEQFILDKQYYLNTFGSFEGIYNYAPRVHFNGYYVLRERYTRRGDHSLDNPGIQVHLVEYYKYVRFFPNGSLLYKLSNRKLKDEEIAYALSSQRFKEDETVIKGEYLQYKQLFYMRFARRTSLFYYECTIGTRRLMFDTMTVMHFGLELIENSMMTQQLYLRKINQQDRIFAYKAHEEIAKENSPSIQACSL